ncbi:MAG: gamma-glutamyltransferase [Bacteroidota bacterium]
MSYAISGGHQKTIEAAKIILDQGGNAVDAAIAAYLVSFISEPCMASLGAGGFAMINDTESIKLVDFFCQTPKFKKKISEQQFYPVVVDFGNTTEEFQVGKGSIAVPGAVAGMYKMHKIWGKIPFSELFAPALEWSKEGIALDRFQAYDITLLQNIFKLHPKGKELFFDETGKLKAEGQNIKMPGYHDFLDALKHEGEDLFYKGEIAKQISEDMLTGGHLTRADFEEYEVHIADPISFRFFDHQIYTPGFPSVGGMLITAILNAFQDLVVNDHMLFLSIQHFQKLLDAFSKIQSLQNDPRKISDYLISQFGINSTLASNTKGEKWGGTSHFNVIDRDGMTVCLTTSIGEGSGYFIPGTDMQMNNMLGEEALMPNGFHNWTPDARLQSMMSPSIVLNSNGSTLLGIGSGGAGRIPYAIAQVIINMLYFNMNVAKAIESPRVHIQSGTIEIESGFDFEGDLFENLNQWNAQSLFFGGTNVIYQKDKRYQGFADQRRFGAVIEQA